MTEEATRALADAFNRAQNAHDAAKIGQQLAEDVVYWEANLQQPIKGRKAVEEHFRENWKAFPDASIKVANRILSGDWVAEEGDWTATNKGPLNVPGQPPLPATGKRVGGKYVAVAKAEKGKVASLNIYYDNLAFLSQLGLMSPPGSR